MIEQIIQSTIQIFQTIKILFIDLTLDLYNVMFNIHAKLYKTSDDNCPISQKFRIIFYPGIIG